MTPIHCRHYGADRKFRRPSFRYSSRLFSSAIDLHLRFRDPFSFSSHPVYGSRSRFPHRFRHCSPMQWAVVRQPTVIRIIDPRDFSRYEIVYTFTKGKNTR